MGNSRLSLREFEKLAELDRLCDADKLCEADLLNESESLNTTVSTFSTSSFVAPVSMTSSFCDSCESDWVLASWLAKLFCNVPSSTASPMASPMASATMFATSSGFTVSVLDSDWVKSWVSRSW